MHLSAASSARWDFASPRIASRVEKSPLRTSTAARDQRLRRAAAPSARRMPRRSPRARRRFAVLTAAPPTSDHDEGLVSRTARLFALDRGAVGVDARQLRRQLDTDGRATRGTRPEGVAARDPSIVRARRCRRRRSGTGRGPRGGASPPHVDRPGITRRRVAFTSAGGSPPGRGGRAGRGRLDEGVHRAATYALAQRADGPPPPPPRRAREQPERVALARAAATAFANASAAAASSSSASAFAGAASLPSSPSASAARAPRLSLRRRRRRAAARVAVPDRAAPPRTRPPAGAQLATRIARTICAVIPRIGDGASVGAGAA